MVSSQYSLKSVPAGVRVTERLLRKKRASPISLSRRWIVLVSPDGVILHSRALFPKCREEARCLKSSSSLIFIKSYTKKELLSFILFLSPETLTFAIGAHNGSVLQNMQYNITNKSLDATGVSQYIKYGLTSNQYRLAKNNTDSRR